ncbi:MAG: hypothetical protein SVU94_07160 [Bacteroidota bacterium]|nr:hypothetical protein [Bacteroidota bacterium]
MKIDKRSLIRWKVYLDRSKMYISYINLFMMVTIFLGAIKNTGVGKFLIAHVYVAIPVLIIIFIFLALLLGYWDSKYGIRSEEMRNLTSQNPIQMEILESVRDIKKNQQNIESRLDKIENELLKK